jgi:ABC-type transport system involved in multi-copper enzyme maturation permease subunit
VWAISLNSFREALRNKVLGSLFGLSIIVLVVGTYMGEASLHNEVRVATNSGLFLTTMFTVLIGVYASVSLFHTEIEKRTLYTLMSKPIEHWHFIVGKLFGVTSLCTVVAIILGISSASLVLAQGGTVSLTFVLAFLMPILQAFIVSAISILFATFSGSLLAGICSLTVFVVGNLQTQIDLAVSHFEESTPLFVPILKGVRFVFPDFEALNLSYELTYNANVPLEYWLTSLLYSASYVALIVLLSVATFKRYRIQ